MKWKKESNPSSQESSTSKTNGSSVLSGKEKPSENLTEGGKDSEDKKAEWKQRQDGIKLCKYPCEISISILLGLAMASMILEFNLFLANIKV